MAIITPCELMSLPAVIAAGKIATLGIPAPIMIDITAPYTTEAGARRYGTTRAAQEITSRLAVLTNSPVTRMMGNAFMLAMRPPYPTRLFSREESAVLWLIGEK